MTKMMDFPSEELDEIAGALSYYRIVLLKEAKNCQLKAEEAILNPFVPDFDYHDNLRKSAAELERRADAIQGMVQRIYNFKRREEYME